MPDRPSSSPAPGLTLSASSTFADRFLRPRVCLLLCLCLGVLFSLMLDAAQAQPGGKPGAPAADLPVTSWLTLGPVAVRLPAFSDTASLARRSERVLGTDYLDSEKTLPAEGQKMPWQPGRLLSWTRVEARDSVVVIAAPRDVASLDTAVVHVAHLACYLDCPRWQKLELVLKTRQRAAVYVDGKLIKRKDGATRGKDAPEEFSCELTLTRDKHLVVVKTVFDGRDSQTEWTVAPLLRVKEDARQSAPVPSLAPARRFSMDDMMKMKSVREAALSPDGRMAALVVSEPDMKRNEYVSHLLVLDAKTGAELYALKTGDGVSGPEWAPDSRRLVFVSYGAGDGAESEREGDGRGGGADLWLLDMATRNTEKLISQERGLGGVSWSPDGQYLYYTAWEPGLGSADGTEGGRREGPGDRKPYEKLEELYERWDYWKHKSHIFVLSLESRTRLQLTAGKFTVGNYELSPDGGAVAFQRSVPVKGRPFFETELWRLDTHTLAIDSLLSERLEIQAFAWSPDSRSIALIGESSVATPEDAHNRYEQSLYLLDVASRKVQKMTEGFVPNVGVDLYGGDAGKKSLWWDGAGRIFFLGTDRSRVRLYSVGTGAGRARATAEGGRTTGRATGIRETALPDPVCSYFDVSADRDFLLCVGTSLETSQKVWLVDLRKQTARKLLEPAQDVMKRVEAASVVRQDFVDTDGVTIDAWLYYPPGFDSTKTYPLIVYYYGGVVPMGDYFNGSAHWLAGQGYFVYVLTPRGATGYGQPFADAHVNDWGELSARDVIEGVGKVLASHPFLDGNRVGCYGGSYGGFMTMSLLTQTDMFKAGVSWYGISNIASYWGAGWWGYLYNDVAAALSFPWNRPDVYAEKSPLFHADKLKGALLLMHGLDDINVPALESDQMFTALKVLDKDVVYIRWSGEGHGIRGTPQNSRDGRLMMLEWFDKHLKDEPGAWAERWKAGNGPGKGAGEGPGRELGQGVGTEPRPQRQE